MRKVIETIGDEEVVFDDYPINKFAKKVDWWTSEKGIGLSAKKVLLKNGFGMQET